MTPKKFLRSKASVAFTPHLFWKRFVRATITFVEFTEKVQAWKLFSEEKLYLE
jgi:hypothetical protein